MRLLMLLFLLFCALVWTGCDLSNPVSPEEPEESVDSDGQDLAIYYNQGPEAFIPVPGGRSEITNAAVTTDIDATGDDNNDSTPGPDEVWLPGDDGDPVGPEPDGVVSNPTDPDGGQEDTTDPGVSHDDGKVIVPVVVRSDPAGEGGEDPVDADDVIDADSSGNEGEGVDHVPAEEDEEDEELVADDVID